MKKLFAVLAFVVFGTGLAHAKIAQDSEYYETGVTSTGTAVFEAVGKNISMQVDYTSTTFAAATFTGGRQSTFTITVASNTAVSTASATGFILVQTTVAMTSSVVKIGSLTFSNPTDWTTQTTATGTACAISGRINNYRLYVATCNFGGGVNKGTVTVTAPYGTQWNNLAFTLSTTTLISSGSLSGGVDATTITINGVSLVSGKDFAVGSSSAITANNIAVAIATNTSLSSIITASAPVSALNPAAVVYSTSVALGPGTWYATTSSSQSALTISPYTSSSTSVGWSSGTMYGGVSSSWTINTATITIAAPGFRNGLQVLYTGSPAIGGITTGTTYYVSRVDDNNFMLATSTTNAATGQGIPLTSSQTVTTANTYTLTPLAITGTPGFKWEVSNDRAIWTQLTSTVFGVAVTSVTITSYTLGGASAVWDLGAMAYHWLRLNITGPMTGGVSIRATVIGKD